MNNYGTHRFSFTMPFCQACQSSFSTVDNCTVKLLDVRTGDSFCGECTMQLHLRLRIDLRLRQVNGCCSVRTCTRLITVEVPRGTFNRCGLLRTGDCECELESFRINSACGAARLQLCLHLHDNASYSGCVSSYDSANACSSTCTSNCTSAAQNCTCANDDWTWNNGYWYLTDGTRYQDNIGRSSCTCTCGHKKYGGCR